LAPPIRNALFPSATLQLIKIKTVIKCIVNKTSMNVNDNITLFQLAVRIFGFRKCLSSVQ
jgi:hypothetical protein